jgi:beta-glucosidase
MSNKARELLQNMSLKDKARLASGKDFWHLEEYEPANLKSIMVTDGPHGLRKQSGKSDHLGIMDSVPATCFPTASGLASSWNEELLFHVGKTLAEECKSEQVSVLLGPGANIKRHPLCGRNFEYFSEDPLLSGKMAAAWINGLQSQGVGASLKHYVANNQESHRMVSDSIIDERTLHELYLKSFEIAVKESQPWTIMCSYNKVNGTYLSEHHKLLQIILKNEWNHKGLVVTDWGACNDRVEGIIAGQELEMPSSGAFRTQQIIDAVKNGRLSEDILDQRIERVINLMIKGNENLNPNPQPFNQETHHQFARRVAAETIVLLKNDETILPLKTNQTIALIGEFAEKPRYQGAGSSMIKPTKIGLAIDAFKDVLGENLLYAKGYDVNTDQVDDYLIEEAVAVAQQADVVVIMAGLTNLYESEGFDRNHLNLPTNHTALINRIADAHNNVIVALSNGAPVIVPWKDNVKAILEQYLGGQASGEALADIVFGRVNPSAKLAETFPNHLSEFPSNQHFPGVPRQVQYREGLYVGYRAYDSMKMEPLFPFGYGLSYTTFSYEDLQISIDEKGIKVMCTITNTGLIDGKEIVQVYVHKPDSNIYRVAKELKGFAKVYLGVGESKQVEITIPTDLLQVYNEQTFKLEPGTYVVDVAASSRDIRLSKNILLQSNDIIVADNLDFYQNPTSNFNPTLKQFERMYGHPIPKVLTSRPYHINSTIGELADTFIGKQLKKMVSKQMNDFISESSDEAFVQMVNRMVDEMPLRSLVLMSNGALTQRKALGLIDLANKKPIRGLIKLIRK